MKATGRFNCCLAVALMAFAAAQTGFAALGANPYSGIPSRNPFGLNPIPTNAPVDPATITPPVKITPTGIMNILGKLQVVVRIPSPAKPGQPPKEESYILGVGERQDNIEVVKIDEATGTISFINNGIPEERKLVAASGSSGPAAPGIPAGAHSPFPNPMSPAAIPLPASMAPGAVGGGNTRSTRNKVVSGGNPGVGAMGSPGVISTPNVPVMSPEEQILRIETQRKILMDRKDPSAAILPPTIMTPQNLGNSGNFPVSQ